MTRKELAAAARRRAIELLIADPKLSLHDAEVAAVRELKAIAKLQSREVDKLGQLATPSKAKPGGGARARLASVLEAISSRMSAARAVLPRGLSSTAPAREAPRVAPRTAPLDEEPGDVCLVYAGGPTGATRIDHEFPIHPAVAAWHASIERNRRGGSSS
jgi:hypothetical protein